MSSVRMEGTGAPRKKQVPVTEKKGRHVRRWLTYDDVSYFDNYYNNDHDHDEQDPSMKPIGSHRSSRGFNEPRTRDHYHVQTRSSKRRTRS